MLGDRATQSRTQRVLELSTTFTGGILEIFGLPSGQEGGAKEQVGQDPAKVAQLSPYTAISMQGTDQGGGPGLGNRSLLPVVQGARRELSAKENTVCPSSGKHHPFPYQFTMDDSGKAAREELFVAVLNLVEVSVALPALDRAPCQLRSSAEHRMRVPICCSNTWRCSIPWAPPCALGSSTSLRADIQWGRTGCPASSSRRTCTPAAGWWSQVGGRCCELGRLRSRVRTGLGPARGYGRCPPTEQLLALTKV